MGKILITTSSFNLDTPEISALEASGYEIMMNPYGRRLKEEEAADLLSNTPDLIAMIAGVEPLTETVLASSQSLQIISRCGTGLDSVDLEAAKNKGIKVYNTPDAPTDAVAELTIGLILNCLRGTSIQDRGVRQGEWPRPMGSLFGESTLGLIGFGRIGRRVAEFARAFGANCLVFDPVKPDLPQGAQLCSLEQLMSGSDIVSLHIPYTPENHHLINADLLGLMKSDAYLINTARGGLVDEAALYDALKAQKIAGAALDVFEDEPYSGPLKDLDIMVLSAHVGSYAKQARQRQETEAVQNLLDALQARQIAEKSAHGG